MAGINALFTQEDKHLADRIRETINREKQDYPDADWESFMQGFVRGMVVAGEMMGVLQDDIDCALCKHIDGVLNRRPS